MLVFDGDVGHTGSEYSVGNTHLHVYLDVVGLKCDSDFTWVDV